MSKVFDQVVKYAQKIRKEKLENKYWIYVKDNNVYFTNVLPEQYHIKGDILVVDNPYSYLKEVNKREPTQIELGLFKLVGNKKSILREEVIYMPPEITKQFLMNMDYNDIIKSQRISKDYDKIIKDDNFWCELLKRDFKNKKIMLDTCRDTYEVYNKIKDRDLYESYHRVLHQVHHNLDIRPDTEIYFVGILYLIDDMIKGNIITEKDIKKAIEKKFVGGLTRFAISEGEKSIVKYGQSKNGTILQRAGLTISEKIIPSNNKLSEKGLIYLLASIEYLFAEILELAGNVAKDNKREYVEIGDIQSAIKSDVELYKMLGNYFILDIPFEEYISN